MKNKKSFTKYQLCNVYILYKLTKFNNSMRIKLHSITFKLTQNIKQILMYKVDKLLQMIQLDQPEHRLSNQSSTLIVLNKK